MLRGRFLSILMATSLLAAPAYADEVFRVQLPATVIFTGDPPTGTPNNPIELTVQDVNKVRVFSPATIAVSATGAQVGDVLEVVGLPSGMTWSGSGLSGVVSGAASSANQYQATARVMRAGVPVATQTFTIHAHDVLSATTPSAAFTGAVGEMLEISPSASNAMGDVLWTKGGGTFPDWLSLDAATGMLSGIPDAAGTSSALMLTATDQLDFTTGTTDPFSIEIGQTCGLWNARSASEATSWYGVAYGAGRYVAVASSGKLMTSTDGATWTSVTPPETSNWIGVTFGGGRFVAVANGGTNRAMTSTDGLNWTMASVPASDWYAVTYGDGKFVAVANSGTIRAMTSPDGLNWTSQAIGVSAWRSVTYGGGLFVAVADGGTNRIATSEDGVTWVSRMADAMSWRDVSYGNGRFVAVATAGTNRAMTSADGLSWTSSAVPEANSWISLAFGDGQFVAVAYDGTNRVMTSTDGVNWTVKPAAAASFWRSIVYTGAEFLAVANGGPKQVMTTACLQ